MEGTAGIGTEIFSPGVEKSLTTCIEFSIQDFLSMDSVDKVDKEDNMDVRGIAVQPLTKLQN